MKLPSKKSENMGFDPAVPLVNTSKTGYSPSLSPALCLSRLLNLSPLLLCMGDWDVHGGKKFFLRVHLMEFLYFFLKKKIKMGCK
jgi:hypothetical protein